MLLSGAVAIVLEGTPLGIGGTGPSQEVARVNSDGAPEDETQQDETDKGDTPGRGWDRKGHVSDPTPVAPMQVGSNPAEPIPGEADALDPIAPPSGEELAELEPRAEEIEDVLIAAPGVPLPLPAPREVVTQELQTPEAIVSVEPDVAAVEVPSPVELAEPEPVQAPRPLKIATEGDFAPFNFLNETGEVSGFDVDIAKELCRRLTRECVFLTKGWADLVPSLQRGEVDLIAASMRIPSVRRAGLAFSDPYYGSRGRFVTARGAQIVGIGALQASGAQIAVQQGSLHEAYLRQNQEGSELRAVPSLDAALELVSNGTVEAAFGDNAAILQWMKNTNCCALLGTAVTDTKFFGDGIGLVLRESDLELTAAVNKHLQEMASDGTSATLSERYFSGSIY